MIRWDVAGPYAVVFTTREGGVSEGAFASLNLGLATDDRPEHVHENRRRVVTSLGGDPEALALNRQVHGAAVLRARAGSRGQVEGDALWTDEPGLPVGALTADCVPIALVREAGERPAVAVVHAGWRGLLAGVVPAAVETLGGKVAAAVGPAIGPCCFEIGDEVARSAAGRVRRRRRPRGPRRPPARDRAGAARGRCGDGRAVRRLHGLRARAASSRTAATRA